MRPRPEDRGELPRECRAWGLPELQCGHGPKTVENQGVWTHSPRDGVASMRPRPEDRGEPAVADRVGRRRASMRPRPEDRGELVSCRMTDGPHASMRPRPEGRGEHGPCRGFHGVQRPLQCGHGPKAVENPEAGRLGGMPAGFNAATARRPWRTSPRPHRHIPEVLQCGHGPKAVENTPLPVRPPS